MYVTLTQTLTQTLTLILTLTLTLTQTLPLTLTLTLALPITHVRWDQFRPPQLYLQHYPTVAEAVALALVLAPIWPREHSM